MNIILITKLRQLLDRRRAIRMNRSTQNYYSADHGGYFGINSSSGDQNMNFNTAGKPTAFVPPPLMQHRLEKPLQMAAMMMPERFRYESAMVFPVPLVARHTDMFGEFSAGENCNDLSKHL